MRLVWMDTRTYTASIHPSFATALEYVNLDRVLCRTQTPMEGTEALEGSWTYSWIYHLQIKLSCDNESFRSSSYIRLNQGLLVITIVSCIIVSRFFTKYWTISLLIAVLLLSRGRLIAANGDFSGWALLTTFTTIWLTGICHWVRSGSKTIFYGLLLGSLLSLVLDLVFAWIFIGFAFGFFLLEIAKALFLPSLVKQLKTRKSAGVVTFAQPKNRRSFTEQLNIWLRNYLQTTRVHLKAEDYFSPGGVFKSLRLPFLLWIQHHKLWRYFRLRIGFLLLLQFMILIYFVSGHPPGSIYLNEASLATLLETIDLDLVVALGLISVVALFGPNWDFSGFWECLWFLLLIFLCTLYGSGLMGMVEQERFGFNDRLSQTILLFEPILLTFGALCSFQLLHGLVRVSTYR
ncbi:MAG: hypothetical protein HRU19_22875 [Pseudobacteriovorax sp.]|nr:hypothetical protein [Pseudobacteriovorax sp.]